MDLKRQNAGLPGLQTRVPRSLEPPPSHAAPSSRATLRAATLAPRSRRHLRGARWAARGTREVAALARPAPRSAGRQAGCCVAAHGLLHRPSIERGGQPELPSEARRRGWRRARQFKKRTNIHALIHTEKAVEIPAPASGQASAARLSSGGRAKPVCSTGCRARLPHPRRRSQRSLPPVRLSSRLMSSPLMSSHVRPFSTDACLVLCTRAGVSVGHAGLRAISLERGLGLRGMRGGS